MFSQACVKNSVHGGSVYPTMHWGRNPPGRYPRIHWGRHPPSADTPWQADTRTDTNSPSSPPPPTATAADGTHPTAMHSCNVKCPYFSAGPVSCEDLPGFAVKETGCYNGLSDSMTTWHNAETHCQSFGNNVHLIRPDTWKVIPFYKSLCRAKWNCIVTEHDHSTGNSVNLDCFFVFSIPVNLD